MEVLKRLVTRLHALREGHSQTKKRKNDTSEHTRVAFDLSGTNATNTRSQKKKKTRKETRGRVFTLVLLHNNALLRRNNQDASLLTHNTSDGCHFPRSLSQSALPLLQKKRNINAQRSSRIPVNHNSVARS